MKRFICLLCFIISLISSHGQDIVRHEADSMLNALRQNVSTNDRIDLFLGLAKFHIFKPGEKKTDLDSAADYLNKASGLNASITSKRSNGYIQLVKSFLLRESGQRDNAREAARIAVSLLKDQPDKNLSGEAYMELSGYLGYNDSKELAERIELVKSAVSCYDQSGNIQQKAASLQMLGDLYNIKGSSYIALQQLQASLDAYNSIKYAKVQGIYCLMGFIYARLREYRKGLDKELLALKTAEATGDSSMQLCEIYNYLGEVLNPLGEKERAAYYYTKALEVAQKHHEILGVYIASVNIANIWAAMNQPYKALNILKGIQSKYEKPTDNNLDINIARCYINIYSSLKQFEKARPYAKQLLHMIDSLNMSAIANIRAYTVAIKFFIAAGENAEARKYLDRYGELAQSMKDYYYMSANQKLRFMLDTTRYDYKAAVAHLLEYNRLNDSLSLETKSRQIEELQVQYETEKKEQDILLKSQNIQLLTRKSQLQLAKIENDRIIRIAMFVGAGLLLLVLLLVYSRYRQKQKSSLLVNRKNDELQHLLSEKEWLLKEIHHRVKNNLQIVMSLLNSQTAFIDNPFALTAIHDSQHRVHAMSLIHQKLYGSENVSSVDMSVYIREMVSYLTESFNTGQRIRFEYQVEPIEMDVSQAVPLGLILNEAVTNAIKYAFPDGRNGLISISLSQVKPDNFLLRISDNGIGISSDAKNRKSGSLGMSLMQGLSEDLNGVFSMENQNGTTINISFVQEQLIMRSKAFSMSSVSSN